MESRIELLTEKKLVGKRLKMSLSNNKTFELWQSFMMCRKEITHCISIDLYSMQIYDSPSYFQNFNPHTEFEKWATVEVLDFNTVSEDMETFTLKSELYAVFIHKGTSERAAETFSYIMGTWLLNSEYEIDDRPHFEILGEKYRRNCVDSEEEVWIPIKVKQ